MGYSTSTYTLDERIRSGELDLLAKGQACTWIVSTGLASKFAYKIREALYIARLHADQYPSLAQAADQYVIEVANASTVFARHTASNTEATVLATGGSDNTGTTTHGLEKAGRAIQSNGPQSQFTIIDTWRKAEPSSDSIHFPTADLNDEQLEQLWLWSQNHRPPLMLMVSGESITVSLWDEHVGQYAWTPKVKVEVPSDAD